MGKRITTMNQYGDILYTGQYKEGNYRGYGDYPERLNSKAVKEILDRLFFYEEALEDLMDNLKNE